MKQKPLSRSALPILGLLTWWPMAGYEIRSEIDASLGNFWSESFGQLYPQLKTLADAGLIEETLGAENDTRGKRVYKITDAGRAALATWLSEPPKSRPVRDELLLKVFFAAEGDTEDIQVHVSSERNKARQTLAHYLDIQENLQRMKSDKPKTRHWLMTVRLGIARTEGLISWCDEVLTELKAERSKTYARDARTEAIPAGALKMPPAQK